MSALGQHAARFLQISQAVEGIVEVDRLAVPAREAGESVDLEPGLPITPCEIDGGLSCQGRSGWCDGKGFPPRGIEAAGAVGIEDDAESSFVKRPVVEAAEQQEVVEVGFAAVGPVLDMVGVAVLHIAAREMATAIAMVQGAAHGGVNGAGFAPDVDDPAIWSVLHDDPTRLASEPPGRFS